jgi:hypothetical protein
MSGLVAIHQPNFFPWLGYFDKIRRADIFVFLDAVDYPRSGSGGMGSWLNRVKLNIQGEARWVTCPLKRMPLGSSILEAQIDDRQPWRTKLAKSLQSNYGKAKRFRTAMAELEPLIHMPEQSLADFNFAAIATIAKLLGVSTRFVRQSEIAYEGHSSELLISLTRSAGGSIYMAGGGAGGYQDDALFAASGIALAYQNFTPKPYGPPHRFVPGLSVIDYLMHDGRPLAEAFPDGVA